MGSTRTLTLSLKTTNRRTALATASHLLGTLRAFHLNNPTATWEDLRERLRDLAADILQTRSVWDRIGSSGHIYADVREELEEIAVTEPLSLAQAKALDIGKRLMTAAEWRALGALKPLTDIMEELGESSCATVDQQPLGVPDEVVAPKLGQPSVVTFASLAARYMDERKGDLQPTTMKNIKASCSVIGEILGDLDLLTHTRADMLALKERLKEGRKSSTVNKLLTNLSTVLGWAEANAYITHAYDKKLQIMKGADSERVAFTPAQIETIMGYANSLPNRSWQRWALSLGVITGARIGEIYQLTSKDFYEIDGVLVVDLNDSDGKTLKNKFSARKVPLVSVLGADLEGLKEFAEAANGKLFKRSSSGFTSMLNQLIRDILGTETKVGLSFHSLRHHLAGALKAAEVPLGTAQEILGHSSGSITFDLYGAGRSVQIQRMAEALKVALVSDSGLTYLPNKNLIG